MVLYILRHERRNLEKVDFFTPLNHIGKHNADTKIFEKFNDIDIETIYSSPYKRTLQTIDKISRVKDIPIKLDWALSEKIGPEKSQGLIWPSYEEQSKVHELFSIDDKYSPTADRDYINSYDESIDSFITRVDTFSQYLQTQKDKNILVVSHQSITDRIIKNLTNEEYQLEMGECYEIDL